MSQATFAPLLEQFGAALGIPGLCLDEQHTCMLSIDAVTLSLEWHEPSRALTVYAPVGKLDKDCGNDVLRALLTANCLGAQTGGFCLGLEESLNVLFLSGQYISSTPSVIELERFIQFFVDKANIWLEKVEELTQGTPKTAHLTFDQGDQALPDNFMMLRI